MILCVTQCPVATCDLNEDGEVNILDSQFLINQIPPPVVTFDLNEDGTFDDADVDLLSDVILVVIQCPVATCDLNEDG